MAKFRDNQKREWIVSIDIPHARQIRNELDVDILNLEVGLPALARDPILLCDVLFLLVREQAETKKVSDEDFGRSLVGDAIGEASEAFVEALTDFSPPRQRAILKAMQRTAIELETMLAGMAETKIPRAMQELQDAVCGKQSAVSPESSDTNHEAASAS